MITEGENEISSYFHPTIRPPRAASSLSSSQSKKAQSPPPKHSNTPTPRRSHHFILYNAHTDTTPPTHLGSKTLTIPVVWPRHGLSLLSTTFFPSHEKRHHPQLCTLSHVGHTHTHTTTTARMCACVLHSSSLPSGK